MKLYQLPTGDYVNPGKVTSVRFLRAGMGFGSRIVVWQNQDPFLIPCDNDDVGQRLRDDIAIAILESLG